MKNNFDSKTLCQQLLETNVLEGKSISIFLTLWKMAKFSLQKLVIFIMITYAFLVEKSEKL